MEIIPVISIVLVIVFALTLLTLAISYIYNKVKKGETAKSHKKYPRPPEKEEIIEDHLKPIPRPFEDKVNKQIEEKKKDEDQKKQVGKISNQKKDDKNSDKPKNRNKRLTILKNLSDTKRQEPKIQEVKKKVENEPSNSLRGEILDKYIEESDPNMYTLNVKIKKEKPKE